MKPRPLLLLSAFLAVPLLGAAAAQADDKAECLDASSKGQTLRDANKLLEARDQFRVCARLQCPAVVQTDCASWLDAVEKNIPTVVITARDDAGATIIEVKVTVDGAPLATSLDGRAIAMNPGPHKFHFELADGTSQDVETLVTEGTQNQPVAAVLKRPPQPPPPGVAPPPPPPLPSAPPAPPASEASSPWHTVGWIVGGVGVAGLAVGTIFGIVAIGDKSSAHCAGNECDLGPLNSARNAARVSDVGLVAGGVLTAGGAALVLLTPGGGRVTVTPAMGSRDGGILVGGRW